MKPDQERVKNLLTDTVTLLCKNGLTFSKELRVEGLLGITTDSNDVFFIHISDTFGENGERITKDTSDTLESGKNDTESSSRASPHAQRNRPERPSSHESMPSPKTTPQKSHNSNSNHRQSTHSPLEPVRIKQETSDDDLIIMDAKSEFKSSCALQRSHSDSHIGSDNYGGLELSVDNIPGNNNPYDDTDHEPPTKRRATDYSEDSSSAGGDSLGAYVTGVVQNIKVDPSQLQTQSPWTSSGMGLTSEIAAQMAQAAMAQGDNSLSSLDSSMPGPSSWSPGQAFGTPSSQPSDMGLPLPRGAPPRRSRYAIKPFPCDVEGCTSSYYLSQHLLRHKRNVHKISRNDEHALPDQQTSYPHEYMGQT